LFEIIFDNCAFGVPFHLDFFLIIPLLLLAFLHAAREASALDTRFAALAEDAGDNHRSDDDYQDKASDNDSAKGSEHSSHVVPVHGLSSVN